MGGLFVRIGIPNELGLIPGAREWGTVGRPLIYPFHRERRPLQHAGDKGETAAKMRGASMGAGCGSSVGWVLRSPLMAGSCAQVGKSSASTWAASTACVLSRKRSRSGDLLWSPGRARRATPRLLRRSCWCNRWRAAWRPRWPGQKGRYPGMVRHPSGQIGLKLRVGLRRTRRGVEGGHQEGVDDHGPCQ